MSRFRRAYLVILDAVLINIAAVAALYLRFELRVPSSYLSEYQRAAPYFTLISLGIFAAIGLYSVILRYASVDQLLASAAGSVLSSGVLWLLLKFWIAPGYPRSALIITGMLEFLFLAGLRVSVRLFNRVWNGFFDAVRDPGEQAIGVLIVGAGDAGVILGKELSKPSVPKYKLLGYIDDDPSKRNTTVCGARVYGNRDLIPSLVERLQVNEIIVAMPSVSPAIVREIVSLCQDTGVKIRALPRVLDMAGKPFEMGMIKDIDIEDLLGRPEVHLDTQRIEEYLRGKKVLITGAGGSIGSEICRQVAAFNPGSLILLGHGENSIFEARMVLDREFPEMVKESLVADVRDSVRIKEIFSVYRPDVVFHAAAHKHVPLMEQHIQEAIKTNVFGTLNVAKAALVYEARRFVMISTDKAVNPTSVMGASKRVAELVVQSMNCLSKNTQFVSVRFGNVLGSRGSVVPVFRRQIAEGGPVTVTHPDMRRYFMTKKEAVELVLQAGAMGHGGEIFVLDMGEPVRILDMAEQMIRLSGHVPYDDIPIVFTGIRPGEKLFEEILTAEEGTSATHHSQIFVARQNPFSSASFFAGLAKLENLVFPRHLNCRVFTGETPELDSNLANAVIEEARSGAWELAASRNTGDVRLWESGKDTLIVVSRRHEILKTLEELVPEFQGSNHAEARQARVSPGRAKSNAR